MLFIWITGLILRPQRLINWLLCHPGITAETIHLSAFKNPAFNIYEYNPVWVFISETNGQRPRPRNKRRPHFRSHVCPHRRNVLSSNGHFVGSVQCSDWIACGIADAYQYFPIIGDLALTEIQQPSCDCCALQCICTIPAPDHWRVAISVHHRHEYWCADILIIFSLFLWLSSRGQLEFMDERPGAWKKARNLFFTSYPAYANAECVP